MSAIMLGQTTAAQAGIAEGARVNLTTPHTITTIHNAGSRSQIANFILRNTGKLDFFVLSDGGGVLDPPNEWIVGHPDTVEAALYECRVTEISTSGSATRLGSVAWEADNTIWIDCAGLDNTRIWQLTKDTAGNADWVLTVEVRHKISMTIYGTSTITQEYLDQS